MFKPCRRQRRASTLDVLFANTDAFSRGTSVMCEGDELVGEWCEAWLYELGTRGMWAGQEECIGLVLLDVK